MTISDDSILPSIVILGYTIANYFGTIMGCRPLDIFLYTICAFAFSILIMRSLYGGIGADNIGTVPNVVCSRYDESSRCCRLVLPESGEVVELAHLLSLQPHQVVIIGSMSVPITTLGFGWKL